MIRSGTTTLIWTLALLSCASEINSNSKLRELQVIRGTYNVIWCMLLPPKSSVQSMVEATNSDGDVKLTTPTLPGIPSDSHPILMELGEEEDCGPIYPAFLRSNFMEYKFDIPFVTHKTGNGTPFNYKQVLYESSEIEAESSHLFYKLNATEASMSKTNNSYFIQKNGAELIAEFIYNDTWYHADEIPQFQNYMSILSQPWFGGTGMELCANHTYDFKNAMIRPVTIGQLGFTASLLNGYFPGYHYYIFPISAKNPLGAVQARVNFTMTLPESCSNMYK